MTNSGQF